MTFLHAKALCLRGLPAEEFLWQSESILQEFDHTLFSWEALGEWLVRQDLLGKQHYAPHNFGRFNITLWWYPEFSIQLYVMDGIHTEIHGHEFTGAFKVLEGVSAEVSYRWREIAEIAEGIKRGDLINESIQLLKMGDVKTFQVGHMHRLWRMSELNVSLLMMKHGEKSALPIGPWLLSGVGVERKMDNELRMRQLSYIEWMLTGPRNFQDGENFLKKYLASLADFEVLTLWLRPWLWSSRNDKHAKAMQFFLQLLEEDLKMSRGMRKLIEEHQRLSVLEFNRVRLLAQD